ncbi:MAG: pyridoxal phosphate-dependent aminotransferase [Peptoniphilus sp.]|nr:pyridoxal phosphate-dependent aminotransferase [Peptoniphilus sp.]
MKLSNRVKEVPFSATRVLGPYAEEARKKGKKVHHLNIGAPDTNVPDEFFEAIADIKTRTLPYAPSKGIESLREEISKYYKDKGVDFDAEEIVITNGASEALLYAIISITDLGDNILTSNPFYTNYLTAFRELGISPNIFETSVTDGYRLPPYEEIVKSIDSNTKGILLSNPSNPTGVVYTKEEVERIVKAAVEYDLYIIADEVYREFVFDNLEFYSFGQVEGIKDRLILVDSISKRFGACGARIGCISTKNEELLKEFVKLATSRLAVSTVDQIGATALYQISDKYFKEINEEYDLRRNTIIEELNKIEDIEVYKPQGAFYVMPKLPVEDALDFAKWLLTDFDVDGETLMVAPGGGFFYGREDKRHIRLAYVMNVEDLKKSITILKEGLREYRKLKNL